jgi:hypothetical protein
MASGPIFNYSRWASGSRQKKHRTDQRVARNLGKIRVPMPEGSDKMFRDQKLEVLDAYYERRQYDHLLPWNECDQNGSYIPIHKRQPKVIFNLPKVFSQRLTSKLVGDDVFPTMRVEDDPDTSEYLRMILKASRLKSRILEPVRRYLNNGSVFLRFYFVEGKIVLEHYLAKYCYPTLSESGDLRAMRIRYTYEDKQEKDEKGNPLMRWYQMDLGPMVDILYDNPIFEADKDPVFQEVSRAEHEMGFVQGEWLRTCEVRESVDGYSINEDILDFSDCLNYSLSQSDTAVQYNQDPQLFFKNMDEEEMGNLIRSSTKAWNLGREGDAGFLESGLGGVQTAAELRDKTRNNIMDIARVLMLDPEKIVGSAQSAKAMEVLHGPMVDLVKELRPNLQAGLESILLKMAIGNLFLVQKGLPAAVNVPPGYRPKSLTITTSWPPVFPMTIEDLQKKVSLVQSAVSAFLISEETGSRYVAKDFGVEDIEEERAKIAAQPVRNPFGMF